MTVLSQIRPTVGRAGMSDAGGEHESGYATTALNAGTAVCQTAVVNVLAPPAAAGDVARIIGIVGYDPMVTPTAAPLDFPAYTQFPIIREGTVWVRTEQALVLGTTPFCRFVAGGGGAVLGVFRTDADVASAAVVPNAIVTEVIGTTLAKLKINTP